MPSVGIPVQASLVSLFPHSSVRVQPGSLQSVLARLLFCYPNTELSSLLFLPVFASSCLFKAPFLCGPRGGSGESKNRCACVQSTIFPSK